MNGPNVRPMKPVRANIAARPQALFLRADVRNNSPKYPPRVISRPMLGRFRTMETPAVNALNSRVRDSRI